MSILVLQLTCILDVFPTVFGCTATIILNVSRCYLKLKLVKKYVTYYDDKSNSNSLHTVKIILNLFLGFIYRHTILTYISNHLFIFTYAQHSCTRLHSLYLYLDSILILKNNKYEGIVKCFYFLYKKSISVQRYLQYIKNNNNLSLFIILLLFCSLPYDNTTLKRMCFSVILLYE